MPGGAVPCFACGRPVPAQASACPACGRPVAGALDPAAGAEELEAAAAAVASTDEPVTSDEHVAGPEAELPRAGDGLASGGIVPGSVGLGGYLPPSSVYRAPETKLPEQTMPRLDQPPAAAERAAPEPAASPGPRPGQASLFADLPFAAPSTLAGWLVATASGVAAVTFLLPWAPRIANYTSSWGLASLANLPVLGLLIATVALALVPNPVARWIRAGVLPLISGSMFLGLLWPYIVGDFGAEFGSIAGAAGAVVLVAGGILGVAPGKDGPAAI